MVQHTFRQYRGHSLQNPPPLKRKMFYGHGFSCRRNAFFQAPIKLGQPSSASELRTNNFTDTRTFLSYRRIASESYCSDSNHQRSLAVRSHLENTDIGPCRPCVRCVAIRIARLACVGVVFVPRGPAECAARVDCVH